MFLGIFLNYDLPCGLAPISIKAPAAAASFYSCRCQKRTLEALGLKKMNQVVEHEDTPQILGMVNTIKHLLVVEEVK